MSCNVTVIRTVFMNFKYILACAGCIVNDLVVIWYLHTACYPMESHADVDLKSNGNGNGDTHQVQTIYLGNFKFHMQLNRLLGCFLGELFTVPF